ncbi:MAG: hypothetical protein COU29_00535 [Candidatus Magasanikbacteria bacterium CG10_big_fil_rev_8_21_14_0_10_36_32]|uniref:Uncharacterized protein n=1 Tax=Candidatus Magasanikbacteria bacterium CG10_big_fil_rev_8_21_14_0_10_36_32 TaxID=1974646 RepID=A0A2M6W7G2_9BACT|nr:MAG: hypothetical protein COU29_00535 [Candidatus Magasanikbacteria bacterium CG10_big_fil_rev_8_21_14_0_10_36_32]
MKCPRKISLKILMALFIVSGFFGTAIFGVEKAQAQYDNQINASFLSWQAQGEAEKAKAEVQSNLLKNKNYMVMNAVINAMSYFANKISYDMAVWLASGGKGQAPFSSTSGFFKYLGQVTGDSLGESLGSLGESLGLNICDLPDPRLDLALQLGLNFHYAEPTPKCSWQDLKKAYSVENFKSKYLSQEGTIGRLSASVTVKDTDFGIWTDARAKIDGIAVQKENAAQADREEGSGMKAVTDLISGQVKTPAVVVKDTMMKQSADSKMTKEEAKKTGEVWGAFGAGATQVAYKAASTFISTMLGTVLKNFMEGGMLPGGHKVCNPGLTLTGVNLEPCSSDSSGGNNLADNYYADARNTDNRAAAQAMFSQLLIPQIKTLDNYNLIASLAECSPENLSPDSCVVDQSFLQILQSADNGESLTVKQAMEKGWLHGDWKMISSLDKAASQKQDCSQSAYCQRNMTFLRQARILSVGFEFAALLSPVNNPVSLKEVVDNFYTVGSPYYHLINPHWVIKLPKIRCKAFTFSSIAQNGARLEECSDLQHCVGYNKDGSCQTWGYCMKERPIWKFNANYCDSQYSTCRAFTDSDGNSVGYLVRTLDTSFCGEDTDGCRRYSAGKVYASATNSVWLPEEIKYNTVSNYFYNSSLYFNKKLTSCDAKDDGCSAFKLASKTDTLLYLRKAPDYLGCYDADLKSVPAKLYDGIAWPKNLTELSLVTPQNTEACKNYAQVCLPEEENCNLYTSVLNQEAIPGKFKPAEIVSMTAGQQLVWNDQCDASCVGYAAYKEMPSSYTNGENLAYIIPSSGNTCTSYDAGCSAFTNLSTTNPSGMEQTEYFSYLRSCILPDQTKQKTFYLYESSESGGYKLQTFVLEKDATGAPKQIWRDISEIDSFGDCDSTSYAAGTADPDCHQFNDDGGNIYYKYLSKTILVSENCNPYRLNNTELVDGQCPFDFDGFGNRVGNAVEKINEACYYYGLPVGDTRGAGETKVCSAATNSCRAYKGNAGNNVRVVFQDNFENEEIGDWSGGLGGSLEISLESNQINGHSLKNFGQDGFYRQNVEVAEGKSYVLTFWAKGNAIIFPSFQDEGVYKLSFGDAVSLTDVWHYYSFGPLEFNQSVTSTYLNFNISGTGLKNVFIDNIKLMEITDYLYLVKNSLSVNQICDSNLEDNMPGEALGCTAYKDPLNNIYNLTNFSYLCREAAVGCTAVLDTYNTLNTAEPRTYNVWLYGEMINLDGRSAEVVIGGKTFSCIVPTGAKGCYVDIFGPTLAQIVSVSVPGILTSSTIYIPGDTPTSSPIYLVANKSATCKSENIGCRSVGKGTVTRDGVLNPLSSEYEDVAVKNDPALFDDVLCGSESVGCRGYTSGDSKYYFKDPKIIGQRVCAYMSAKNDSGLPIMGWYWKDNKMCGDSSGFCSSDADCAAGVKCQNVPCYPLYYKFNETQGAIEWGLWSFGSTQYKGFVGQCPEEQNGCTEFIDRASSAQVSGKKCAFTGKKCELNSDCNEEENDYCKENVSGTYYLLNDGVLAETKNKCNGMVSQAEGCILLDQTDKPNKYWNTTSTYEVSQSAQDAFVVPVDKAELNDANIILKVTHDRECAEWGYCDLKQDYKDEDTGETTSRCYHLGVCQKATGSSIFNKECLVPVTQWDDKNQELSLAHYNSREAYWDSLDYSGYSVPWLYSIADLTARPLAGDNFHLVHVDYSEDAAGDCNGSADNGDVCGLDDTGKCFNGECLHSPNNYSSLTNHLTLLNCRGNAEDSSPFPSSVLTDESASLDYKIFKSGFESVNLCYDKSGSVVNCDCSYKKLRTSAGDVYTPSNQSVGSSYVCSGGTKQGKFCNGKDDITTCGSDGICGVIQTLSAMNGWQGYCLERDTRQFINGTETGNCLTWWPIEVPPGTTNIWDIDDSAGYQIAEGKQDRFMCLVNEPVINDPEIMMHILLYGSHVSAANDYNIQQLPKSYKIQTAGLDHSFKITDLPPNAAVSGCSDNNADDDFYDPLPGTPSNNVYNYQIYDYDSNKNSKGKFCPINRETLRKDGDTMRMCANPTWDDDNQTYSECPPSGILAADGTRWVNNNYENKYFHRNEIERIDIVFDRIGDDQYADGYISFITDSINAVEGHAFDTEEHFLNKEGESATKGVVDNYEMRCPDWNSIEDGLGNLRAWEWRGGVGVPSWTLPDADDTTLSKMQVLAQGVCEDLYREVQVKSSEVNQKNLAIRVVWDGDYHLRGIWVNLENTGSADVNAGFFFVIHFNDGRCEKFAKVATDTASKDFAFKPFTNNLATGKTINMGSAPVGITLTDRVSNLNGGNYGLAWGEGEYLEPPSASVKEAFVNPFIPWPNTHLFIDTVIFSQGGDYLKNYEMTNFKAGVPLVWARYGLAKYEDGGIYDGPDYTTFNSEIFDVSTVDMPWEIMLENMYAKVFGQYEQSYSGGMPTEFTLLSGTELDMANSANAIKSGLKIYPPHVAAPIIGSTGDDWQLDAISVNDRVSGDIYLVSGSQVHIKFYAWAHGNQMPLRKIWVDKGDGIKISNDSVSFGNRKFKCAEGTCGATAGGWQFPCENNDDCAPLYSDSITDDSTACYYPAAYDHRKFGNTGDTGCHEGPYDFVTDFNCPYGDLTHWPVSWLEPEEQAYIQSQFGDISYVCMVQPKVQVTDNWGWCNGTCKTTYAGGGSNIEGDGCYEDYSGKDCSTDEYGNNKAWTKYNGRLIIIPTQ